MDEDLKVVEGTRIEPEEAEMLDRSTMGASQKTMPREMEVAGQVRCWRLIQCPWCESKNWCYSDTDVYKWFTCKNCSGAFKV